MVLTRSIIFGSLLITCLGFSKSWSAAMEDTPSSPHTTVRARIAPDKDYSKAREIIKELRAFLTEDSDAKVFLKEGAKDILLNSQRENDLLALSFLSPEWESVRSSLALVECCQKLKGSNLYFPSNLPTDQSFGDFCEYLAQKKKEREDARANEIQQMIAAGHVELYPGEEAPLVAGVTYSMKKP